MVRSPSCFRSTTARIARPISRWISWVRPLCRPRLASRAVRVRVERGNMLYSAVIHPLPVPFIKPGTLSSMEAVQITRVFPTSISAEPSAVEMNSGMIFTGRICSGCRLSERKNVSLFLLFFNVYQLNVFDWGAKKFAAETAKLFHRIRSITAQFTRGPLSAAFADDLRYTGGG